ncbi:hypothetical protein T35B1_15851 [Salinisphaera shabanensis T35B1]|uniref:hypothetical protein n=1 Tax=Salinisphaera shabanensis TaxID=180542 RepID=UPI003341623E
MNSTRLVEWLVVWVYRLSPYAWLDAGMARMERRDHGRWRQARYIASECYIVGWLVLSVLLWWQASELPAWLAWPVLLRIAGILNKEIGVVLFGRCKITPGRIVAATGRTIVLALENYATAALLMAFVYTKMGRFHLPHGESGVLDGGHALVQSLSVQFSMSGAYRPLDLDTWVLVMAQSAFSFLFSLIVISLFVSLLDIGSDRH